MIKSFKKEKEYTLKRKSQLQNEAERNKQARAIKKKKVEDLVERRPEIADKFSCRSCTERIERPLYAQNEYLLQAIQDISILGCRSDGRKRNETI